VGLAHFDGAGALDVVPVTIWNSFPTEQAPIVHKPYDSFSFSQEREAIQSA
jgi:hypothetical protein